MTRLEDVRSGKKPAWKWWLDQLGHAGLGAAWSLIPIVPMVLLGVGAGWSIAAGELAAIAGGVLREVIQAKKRDPGKPSHLVDRIFDVAFHVLGPPIAWALMRAGVAIFS